MGNNMMLQLGVGAIFALLVLRLVFDFLTEYWRRKEDRGIDSSPKIDRVLSISKDLHVFSQRAFPMIKDLHDWHNVNDSDGVKIWYVRGSLEKAIDKLADNLVEQTKILQQMASEMVNVKRAVEDFKKD